jgi:hypothetical protein
VQSIRFIADLQGAKTARLEYGAKGSQADGKMAKRNQRRYVFCDIRNRLDDCPIG